MSDNVQDTWQVDAAGKVYDTNFDEMTSWIAEGALIREDKVRKGNLRWIEAGKVPSLIKFFNAKDAGQPIIPVVTVSQPAGAQPESEDILDLSPAVNVTETLQKPAREQGRYTQAGVSNDATNKQTITPSDVCSIHADMPAAYVCESCSNAFCKACPKSYGGSVKICPTCGALCRSIAQVEKKRAESDIRHRVSTTGFGFGDLIDSFSYPFRFTTSLVFGAVMFALFSLGQSATALGNIFLFAAALICYVLANMLTFGVLANVVENFSQGKITENFMPSFEDFSLWDDVVHPFFLSIGVYLTCFGPLFLLVIATAFFLMNSVANEMNPDLSGQTDAARVARPDVPLIANAAKQSERVREILQKDVEEQKRRVEEFESGAVPANANEIYDRPAVAAADAYNQDTEAMVAEANELINQHKKAQLESVTGKTPETIAKEREAMISKVLGYGLGFLVIGGVFLLWGFFYFPAACAVAGYTRSFAATLNPLVGLDTIKRLGVDYVKILFMSLLIAIASSVVVGMISAALSAFDMPGVGNLPAIFVGSLFTFYFSVVFSCVLGFAIYKASDRLKLYQS
ncbi:MAG: hypothetical protein ACKVQW_05110 [Pyrinomonadaceae bacterium]